jgi:hypothetical protein
MLYVYFIRVHYYFYSIGIALPDEYGEAWIDGKRPLQEIGMFDLKNYYNIWKQKLILISMRFLVRYLNKGYFLNNV